jgi:hypothetical protein
MPNLPAIQPPSSHRTAPKGVLLPYRHGEHKWEDYLLDTQAILYAGVQRQDRSAEIQERSAAHLEFIASAMDSWGSDQAELRSEITSFAEQTSEHLDAISHKLDSLTEEVVWGFSTITQRLDYHARLLEAIGLDLKRIASILETPLATQSNELVRSGQLYFRRGLYAEALSDFTDALATRAVDPLLHLHLGQLHYSVRAEGAPFDLDVAEEHLRLSLRYAKALEHDLSNGSAVVDLAARTGAHLWLVRSGDSLVGGDAIEAGAFLRKGVSVLQRVEAPSSDTIFLASQIEALLGNAVRAMRLITHLADAERAWILRALIEPNLGSVAMSVATIPTALRSTPGPQSIRTYAMLDIGDAARGAWASLNAPLGVDQRMAPPDIPRIRQQFELGVVSATQAFDMAGREASKAIGVLTPRLHEAAAMISARRGQAQRLLMDVPKTQTVAGPLEISAALLIGAILGLIASAVLIVAFSILTPGHVESLPFGVGVREGWAFGGVLGALGCLWLEASEHSKREKQAEQDDRIRRSELATQQQIIDDCDRLHDVATQTIALARGFDSRVKDLAQQPAPSRVLADWRVT